ncbi:hypothetical protein PGB90_003062 [Kerria lacca]
MPLKSEKILGIFPTYSKSHYLMNQPITKGLAARGHNVTIISHFKSESNLNNYEEIIFGDNLRSFVDTVTINEAREMNRLLNHLSQALTMEYESCLNILKSHFLQKIIKSKEKSFDLIIAELYYSTCYNLLAYYLNIPLIVILPPTLFIGTDIIVGNPNNPSFVPLINTPYTTKMNFWQRFTNTVQYVIENIAYYYYFNHYMEEISKNYFNIELPTYDTLHKQVALAFYNNHFSFVSRPLVPNAINIAGIHIKESKSLPTEIQTFIDSAKNGVIFFSFGTTVKASSMNPEKLEIIKEVFSSIPQKIIWRTNELNLTDLPSNVMTGQWFPQRDILENKNVKAFISHSGVFGIFEAIHTETPVIGIPFLFDQFQNIQILVDHEAGLYIDYEEMDKNILLESINQIINNTKYANNMKKFSKIFKDRPMSPLDTALYWTEYVLRHDGAPHMRSEIANIPLHQYLLLDVIATVVLSFLFLIYVFYWISINIFTYFKNVETKKKQL